MTGIYNFINFTILNVKKYYISTPRVHWIGFSLVNFPFFRNPNRYLNGSWTKTYWPVRSRYQKEFLNLRAGNLSVGKGYNARKCAFWDSYLPSILGKRGNRHTGWSIGLCTVHFVDIKFKVLF